MHPNHREIDQKQHPVLHLKLRRNKSSDTGFTLQDCHRSLQARGTDLKRLTSEYAAA